MSRLIFSDNNLQCKYTKFFTDLYRRNREILTVAAVIFFVSVFIGFIGPFLSGSFDQYMMKFFTHAVSTMKTEIDGTTLSLFLHNSTNVFFMYFGGIFLGISDIIQLVVNGVLFGFITAKAPISLFYILPHGIFEFSAIVIAGAAGFRLLSAFISVIRGGLRLKGDLVMNEQLEHALKINFWKFKDSLTLFAVAITLLFIAAIIEANITVAMGNYITGLNI